MRQFILPDRGLGRGYMRGGLDYPITNLYKKLDEQKALRASVESFEKIDKLAEKYSPASSKIRWCGRTREQANRALLPPKCNPL